MNIYIYISYISNELHTHTHTYIHTHNYIHLHDSQRINHQFPRRKTQTAHVTAKPRLKNWPRRLFRKRRRRSKATTTVAPHAPPNAPSHSSTKEDPYEYLADIEDPHRPLHIDPYQSWQFLKINVICIFWRGGRRTEPTAAVWQRRRLVRTRRGRKQTRMEPLGNSAGM